MVHQFGCDGFDLLQISRMVSILNLLLFALGVFVQVRTGSVHTNEATTNKINNRRLELIKINCINYLPSNMEIGM